MGKKRWKNRCGCGVGIKSPAPAAKEVAKLAFQPSSILHPELGEVRVTRHAYERFVERFYPDHGGAFRGELASFASVQDRLQYLFWYTLEAELSPEERVKKLIAHQERASFWDNEAYKLRFVVAETPEGPELRTVEPPVVWRHTKAPVQKWERRHRREAAEQEHKERRI